MGVVSLIILEWRAYLPYRSRATALRLASWPLAYRPGMDGDCHRPACCTLHNRDPRVGERLSAADPERMTGYPAGDSGGFGPGGDDGPDRPGSEAAQNPSVLLSMSANTTTLKYTSSTREHRSEKA